MIGFFPDPYPDELLYSVCARYTERTKYLNRQSVKIELFGSRSFSSIVDFPTRLSNLISSFPIGHRYSVKKLIDENTLLPFHEPFLPTERVKIIREEMKGNSSNKLQIRLGTKAKQITSLKYLRFCSQCVINDRAKYFETYWHRAHQLNGIVVCSKHWCFLEESSIEFGRMSGSSFHYAEIVIPDKLPAIKKLDQQDKIHQILVKIARDAEWLLEQNSLHIGSQAIRNRYFNLLLKQGFAYYNGRVRHNKLLKACQEFFPTELFNLIGRVSKKDNWLSVLVQSSNTNITYHSIRHLLLMTFLGLTAKEFFNEFVEFKPFGEPPYPCLNQASDHFKDLRIKNCEIFDNLTKGEKYRRPIAIFNCDCGFVYQRLGPDKSEDDKFSFNSVREYGIVWEKKLTELWATLSLSSSEIAKRIGTSQTSIGRHAIRLNLPMNSEGNRSLYGYKRHRNPRTSFSEMRQNYREKWLQTRLKCPDLTRQELMNVENFIYLWLRRNDSEWFEQNLPKVCKVPRTKTYINWKKIDITLSKKIKVVCQIIKDFPDFPVRVSITEIIKQVGDRVWIDKRKHKLPITDKVIESNLESLEDFMLRKLNWAKQYFIGKRKIPTRNQIRIKAVIRNSISDNSPKIQSAVDKSLIEIADVLSS